MLLDEKHEIRYHFISSLFFCNCYLRCFLVKQKFLCLWSCCIIFNILFTEGEQSMKNCPVAITSGAKSINNFDWAELPQSCDKKLLTRARGAAQPGSDWTMLNFLSSTPHHSLAGFRPLILILLGKSIIISFFVIICIDYFEFLFLPIFYSIKRIKESFRVLQSRYIHRQIHFESVACSTAVISLADSCSWPGDVHVYLNQFSINY